jgi:orotidine-5'-phosphate decarboxylase
MLKHNFVDLAEVQKAQGTLYCAGLDIHPFGSWRSNLDIYGSVIQSSSDFEKFFALQNMYQSLAIYMPGLNKPRDFVELISAIECYLCKIIDILVEKCNIRVFKPQSAFYEQFGPMGMVLLARIRQYIQVLEKQKNIRLICILDCKKGDISTTQAAYFTGLIGNLSSDWGIEYAPYDFDIINVTPWMGDDVLVLEEKGKELLGLQLMRQGKGLIVVNKTSNPSGPQYQELMITGRDKTLQMCNVEDLYNLSLKYDLEYEGLSTLGLVVGSTHPCDGSIRKLFPSTTLLVPGFGAQGGKFGLIMPELIHDGKWNGQGAIFSSSRGTMFPFMENLGGSGKVENLEMDLIKAIENFRINEKNAYEDPAVKELGIICPFS